MVGARVTTIAFHFFIPVVGGAGLLWSWIYHKLPNFFGVTISHAVVGAGAALTVIYLTLYVLSDSGAAGRDTGLSAWVLGQPIVVLSLLQAIVIAGALAFRQAIFDRGGKDFGPSGSILETSVMQACGYDDPDQWEAAKVGAKAALGDYVWSWKFLLGIWFFLYLTIFFTAWVESAEGAKLPEDKLPRYYTLRILTTLFNNLNTLALALCFVALHYPTGGKTRGPTASKRRLVAFITRAVRNGRVGEIIVGAVRKKRVVV